MPQIWGCPELRSNRVRNFLAHLNDPLCTRTDGPPSLYTAKHCNSRFVLNTALNLCIHVLSFKQRPVTSCVKFNASVLQTDIYTQYTSCCGMRLRHLPAIALQCNTALINALQMTRQHGCVQGYGLAGVRMNSLVIVHSHCICGAYVSWIVHNCTQTLRHTVASVRTRGQ